MKFSNTQHSKQPFDLSYYIFVIKLTTVAEGKLSLTV